MRQLLGIIAMGLAIAVTTLIILQIWGIVDLDPLFYGRSLLTLAVLGVALIVFIVLYAIFFWQGNKGPRPGERPDSRSKIL